MRIKARSLVYGGALGALVGLLVAIPPTFLDWRANPGGIFGGPGGTNWGVVWETFFSWLWPVALYAAPVAIVVHAWITGRRASKSQGKRDPG